MEKRGKGCASSKQQTANSIGTRRQPMDGADRELLRVGVGLALQLQHAHLPICTEHIQTHPPSSPTTAPSKQASTAASRFDLYRIRLSSRSPQKDKEAVWRTLVEANLVRGRAGPVVFVESDDGPRAVAVHRDPTTHQHRAVPATHRRTQQSSPQGNGAVQLCGATVASNG